MGVRDLSQLGMAIIGMSLLVALAGCSSLAREWRPDTSPTAGPQSVVKGPMRPVGRDAEELGEPVVSAATEAADVTVTPTAAEVTPSAGVEAIVRPGTGQFVKPDDGRRYRVTTTDGGDITLNFEEAELRQVVKVILGDLLGETYYMDPAIKGTVTVQNDNSLRRDQLLPILEELLQMNGAALVQAPVGYKIVPLAEAEREAQPPSAARWPPTASRGYTVQIIPLEFASADEVAKVLLPYVPEGGSLRPVPQRNILILAAPGHTIEEFLDTVRVFDVDWLEGMSMGMFPLTYADAPTVAGELEQLLDTAGGSPMEGMVRLFPIERLNALLVVTSQRRYLRTMRSWIEDLDRGGDAPGRRLYVYHVRNSKANHIASVLNEVFLSDDSGPAAPPAASIAPGLEPVTLASAARAFATGQAPEGGAAGEQAAPVPVAAPAPAQATVPDAGTPLTALGSVKIIADSLNNTLLVMATRTEYATIEAAIRKLDILPRQVLVEATIAEVRLTDNLAYGVQWFIKGSLGGYNVDVRSLTGTSVNLPVAEAPGFSTSIFQSPADVRVFISALETESQVKVLSSPQLMVTDNQSASINVGTSVPVITSSGSGGATGGTVISEVEYRDTGVLLTVTPHINAGGIVTMEVTQEVSVVGPPVPPSGNVSVDQRTIQSSVSVQSGETIVLGGLIQEQKSDGVTGVPVLSKIPFIGPLFSETSDDALRTELIVLITPKVVNNSNEAKAVTRELRERLQRAGALTL
jgi:general secretion pathway protein D